jgi:site-specific DNA recombinase
VEENAKDFRAVLEEAEFTKRKAFLRSFIEKMEVIGNELKVTHKLPLHNGQGRIAVLPIDTHGGPGGIRTPYLPDIIGTFSQVIH